MVNCCNIRKYYDLSSIQEKMTMRFFVLSAFLTLFLITGPEVHGKKASDPETLLKQADVRRHGLYASPKKMKYRHNWLNCIDFYEDVYTRFPKSDEAPWALYKIGLLYTKLYGYSGLERDLDSAIEIYRKLVKDYQDHSLADDAQYRIGEIFYDQKDSPSQAYVEFLKGEISFPQGDMRTKTQKMLNKLALVIRDREDKKKNGEKHHPNKGLTLVQDIRHWSTPNYTRVVIDLEEPVKYSSHLLKKDPKHKKPRRLYLDFEGTRVGSKIESSIPITDGLLQRARAGQYTNDKVRVVLDIESISRHKIFPLYDPFRIVVDVRGDENEEDKSPTVVKKRFARKGTRKQKEPDPSVSLARQLGLNVKTIVVDPGHGGKDPGTFVKGGLMEKDIVLELSKMLAPKLEKRLRCEVILTRDRDVFLSLEKRTAFANAHNADLFISVHVNANEVKEVKGVETYFLNMATDQRAMRLAAAENATSEKSIGDLQKILNDLMLNTKITESSRLAHEVQKGITGYMEKNRVTVKDLGVKQAPFYVLIGAEMPAVLLEVGFITNPTERRRLGSKKYLANLAEGITAGIDDYIKEIELTNIGG
jgi:N-acetylmuramoyl-L-alanine amidase